MANNDQPVRKARGMNQSILLGHLTADAKQMEAKSGFACRFPLAVNRRFKKKDEGFGFETLYIQCTYFNSEPTFPFLKSGRQVLIDGHLTWYQVQDDQSGRKYDIVGISVDELLLTDNRPRENGEVESSGDRGYTEELKRRNAELEASLDAALAEVNNLAKAVPVPGKKAAPAPPVKKGGKRN